MIELLPECVRYCISPMCPTAGVPSSGLRHPCPLPWCRCLLALSWVTLWDQSRSPHACVISGQFLKAQVQACLWEQKRPVLWRHRTQPLPSHPALLSLLSVVVVRPFPKKLPAHDSPSERLFLGKMDSRYNYTEKTLIVLALMMRRRKLMETRAWLLRFDKLTLKHV